MDEHSISLNEILEALKKRWLLIVFITVTCTLISIIITFFVVKPNYEASTKVFIGKEASGTEGGIYNSNDVQMYQKLMKTYSETIKTRDLIERAIENLDINLNSDVILANITVVPLSDTQILQIKFKDIDPKRSAEVVEVVANEFIKVSKELVPNGNVKIIESVQVPNIAISPNKKLNVMTTFIIGLMIGIGLSLLLEFLDNSFNSKEQLEREINIPVLGVIPSIIEEIGGR